MKQDRVHSTIIPATSSATSSSNSSNAVCPDRDLRVRFNNTAQTWTDFMASPTNLMESPEPPSSSGTLSSRPSLSALSTKDLIPPSRIGQSSPSPDTGNTITPGSSYPSHSTSQRMTDHHGPYATPASDSTPPATSDLVRRHHTLSTASKLVRQERSRVRQALANVPDLSEVDRQYYVPSRYCSTSLQRMTKFPR